LIAELERQQCTFIKIEEQGLDAVLLRHLEQQPFKILVADTQFGMRGIDYRCASGVTMTLVIANAFDCTRDAM
jgi:hypothetical protein